MNQFKFNPDTNDEILTTIIPIIHHIEIQNQQPRIANQSTQIIVRSKNKNQFLFDT